MRGGEEGIRVDVLFQYHDNSPRLLGKCLLILNNLNAQNILSFQNCYKIKILDNAFRQCNLCCQSSIMIGNINLIFSYMRLIGEPCIFSMF